MKLHLRVCISFVILVFMLSLVGDGFSSVSSEEVVSEEVSLVENGEGRTGYGEGALVPSLGDRIRSSEVGRSEGLDSLIAPAHVTPGWTFRTIPNTPSVSGWTHWGNHGYSIVNKGDGKSYLYIYGEHYRNNSNSKPSTYNLNMLKWGASGFAHHKRLTNTWHNNNYKRFYNDASLRLWLEPTGVYAFQHHAVVGGYTSVIDLNRNITYSNWVSVGSGVNDKVALMFFDSANKDSKLILREGMLRTGVNGVTANAKDGIVLDVRSSMVVRASSADSKKFDTNNVQVPFGKSSDDLYHVKGDDATGSTSSILYLKDADRKQVYSTYTGTKYPVKKVKNTDFRVGKRGLTVPAKTLKGLSNGRYYFEFKFDVTSGNRFSKSTVEGSLSAPGSSLLRSFVMEANDGYKRKYQLYSTLGSNLAVNITDAEPPTGKLVQTSTSNGIELKVTNIDDKGGSGYKDTKLPNGKKTTSKSPSQVVTKAGTYRFVLYDNAGNSTTLTKVLASSDFDKEPPEHRGAELRGASYVIKEGSTESHWVKPNTQLNLTLEQFDAVSGNRYQYLWVYGGIPVKGRHGFAEGVDSLGTVGSSDMSNNTVSIDYAKRLVNTNTGKVEWGITPKEDGKTFTPKYHYVDNVGNAVGYDTGSGDIGVVIKTDGVAPNISFRNKGDTGDYHSTDWIKGDGSVRLKFSDSLSGYKRSQYVWSTSTITPSSGWSSWNSGSNYVVKPGGSGEWYLHVRAEDNVGNTIVERQGVYKVDNTAPNTPSISASGSWSNKDQPVSISGGSDVHSGVDKIEYKINNGNWIKYSSTFMVSGNGENEVRARVVDKVGNISDEVVKKVKVDKVSPTGNLTQDPGASVWTNGNVTLNLKDIKDTGGSGYYRTKLPDGKYVTTDKASQVVTTNGKYEFVIYDNAGNSTVRLIDVKNIDKVKPTSPNINVSETWTNKEREVSLSGGTDALSGVARLEYKVGEGAWSTYGKSFKVNSVGETEVKARTVDKAGNVSNEVKKVVRIDRTSPEGTLTQSPKKGEWTNGNVILNLKGIKDSGGSGYYRTKLPNGKYVTDNVINHAVTVNGKYEFVIYDNAGNSTVKSIDVKNIDKVKPTVPSIEVSEAWTNKEREVSLSGGTDALSGVARLEYKVGEGAWVTYGKSFKVNSVGETEVKARAVDKAGNISNEVVKVVRIDKTSPKGTLTQSPKKDEWTKGNVILNLRGIKDSGGSGYYRTKLPDGKYVTDNTASHVVTTNGKYDFVIYDNAGNSTVKSVDVKNIDKIKPKGSLSITSVGETSIGVSIDASDGQSGLHENAYRYYLDGVAKTGWVKDKDYIYKGLSLNRQYDLKVEVRDLVGNILDLSVGETTLAKAPTISTKVISNSEIVLLIDGKGNPGGTFYYVQRAKDGKFNDGLKVVSNWKTDLSIRDSGLVPGETYYYRVKARNSKNKETVYSSVVNDITIPGDPKVTGIEVTDYVDSKSSKELVVKWESKLGVEDYLLYRDGKLLKTVDKSKTFYTDSGLVSNREYSYEVRARNKSGTSGVGNTEKAYTRAHSGKAVDIVDIKDVEFTVDIEVSKVDQGKNPEYKLEVRKVGGSAVENTVDVYSREVSGRVLKGLAPATYYELWLYTRNEDGVVNPGKKVVEEFILNRPPEIELDMGTGEYSEQEGYDEIDIRGHVKDPDKGDKLEIRYSIFRGDKVLSSFDKVLAETKTSTGVEQSFSYKVPIDEKLVEGSYKLMVEVEDPYKERSEEVFEFKVDKTKPVGNLEVKDLRRRSAGLNLKGLRDDFVGLSKKYALLYGKLEGDKYEKEGSWQGNDYIDTGVLESNSKYTYKVDIRDKVDNTLTTNEVEFVTAPEIIVKDKYYLEDDTSTIKIEWEKSLDVSEDVHIEVKRSGTLVGVIGRGKRFLDRNLDYEREYKYTFVAVSEDKNGERLESVPVEWVVYTGVPVLALHLDADYDNINKRFVLHKTVFHKETNFEGTLYYKQGGRVGLFYGNKGNMGESEVNLKAGEYKPFLLSHRFDVGDEFPIRAALMDDGLSKYTDVDVIIEEKAPEVSELSKRKSGEVYGI